ncbi:hypothetical protein CONCODRAFT_7979 [Conidiobolus coronatus NRRL 28638]|uniref:Uncharacterized protein n=1 Tax=Conidiobolus coronatus (strain ATCC 28846 / CBS 209.66 / NRRL 28638) TaxID=796925 RepID=A0A137P3G9_CONC2|nr:hypothetical protein CONCODRAFT_7979 [Conidiobolus coronatus NRRL 28638]|eukprot:KXN69567.1 hypothetical protein CONCODRAFT_7979 [Conidiobolus coronatus NRRL 28638]
MNSAVFATCVRFKTSGLLLWIQSINAVLYRLYYNCKVLADQENRKGTDLVWLILEDKHRTSSTYKHGDVKEKVYPLKVIGLKLVAHNINFCSMTLKQNYLEEIYRGELPLHNECLMYKLESLSFSHPSDRKIIMKYLSIMREKALYNQ